MPRMLLSCTINGEPSELLVQPYHTLLEAVRDVARLTGTKEGCGTGDCGACTVQLDGKPGASCLVLAMHARRRGVGGGRQSAPGPGCVRCPRCATVWLLHSGRPDVSQRASGRQPGPV